MAAPTRKPAAKTSATSATKRTPAPPRADMAMPKVNAPVAPSAASIVMPPPSRMYSPGGQDAPPAEPPFGQALGHAESPLAGIGPQETEFDTGGLTDREPGPAPNPRHPTDRFDHDDDLSADQAVAALAEMQGDEGEETLEQAIERIAKMRKPLGAFHQKLAIDKRDDYHTHWFNDEGNRIAEAVEAGWAFRKQRGKSIRRAVGTGRDKGVLWAYAMDLPNYFWRKDIAAREEFAQSRMDAIQRSPVMTPKGGQAERSDAGKFYSPSDMLTIDKRN